MGLSQMSEICNSPYFFDRLSSQFLFLNLMVKPIDFCFSLLYNLLAFFVFCLQLNYTIESTNRATLSGYPVFLFDGVNALRVLMRQPLVYFNCDYICNSLNTGNFFFSAFQSNIIAEQARISTIVIIHQQ